MRLKYGFLQSDHEIFVIHALHVYYMTSTTAADVMHVASRQQANS